MTTFVSMLSKSVLKFYTKPLLHIFKLFIQTGVFPDEHKTARVTPIFKGGKNWNLENYIPISHAFPKYSKE